ncbi:hypothetical protein BC832DRAFT_475355 [Gaertneriomyces semiglobifer]|nr:hypothetical protein BC832DRAFT_475355 [Gaertneriomyces semiglobifer]
MPYCEHFGDTFGKENRCAREADTLLIHIQSFAKLPAPVRRAMARYATLLHVAPGRLIIKAGHSPLFVYFLLSGACIATDPATSDVRSYSAGECFGAVPLSDPAAPRKVTIEAVVETMLFAVPVDEYVQAVTTGDGTDGAMPIWQCFGPFKDTPPELLKQLMVIATAARYEANQIILPPEERKNICFLIRGTCKILRRVPFVLKRTDIGPPACSPAATPNLSDRSSRPSTSVSLRSSVSSDEPRTSNGLYAVPPGTMPCELLQGEQLIYRMLSLGELEPHAHFPPLRLLQTEAAVYRSQSISSTKVDILQRAVERQYDSHWKNTQSAATKIRAPRDSAQGASEYERESLAAALDMTVLATTPCEVLVIPKMDLVRILDVESIRQLVDPDYEGVVGTRVEDVQKEYLSAKRWETGRASIVAEYRGRNRSSSVGTATGYKRAKEVPS